MACPSHYTKRYVCIIQLLKLLSLIITGSVVVLTTFLYNVCFRRA